MSRSLLPVVSCRHLRAIVSVALLVRRKAYRPMLYSHILALTTFDVAWDLTQILVLPVFEGILDAAFITAAIPTFTALHFLQNQDVCGQLALWGLPTIKCAVVL